MLTLTVIPLALNLCLYLLFFKYGAEALTQAIGQYTTAVSNSLPSWAVSLSSGLLKILGWLVLALVAALSFTIVSGLVAAPFNDALSRAATLDFLKMQKRIAPFTALEHSLSTTIRLEAWRMVVLLGGALVALVVGLIPFLQIPALALGAWLVAFEYFGYPASQFSTKLSHVAWFSFKHLAITLGFGSALLLFMIVPFASIFYIPLAVVGGTCLYARLKLK